MRRLGVILLAGVGMSLMSCARAQDTSSGGNADTTTTAQDPDTTVRAEMLVTALPEGIEGLEIAREGLRVKKGYETAQDTDSSLALIRTGDGQKVGIVICGCSRFPDLGCIPLDSGGILVCARLICSPCGLRVIAGDLQVEIARYEKL